MKVRTATAFVTLRRDEAGWPAALAEAAAVTGAARAALQAAGYDVQTTRIITNPFPEYADCTSAAAAVKSIAALKAALPSGPAQLLNVGVARTPEHVALIPALVAAHGVTASAAVSADEHLVPDGSMCAAAAEAIVAIGNCTPGGEGNFCFCASFNAAPGIPFFPTGYHTSAPEEAGAQPACSVDGFAIGLQFPDVLVTALQALADGAGDVVAAHAHAGGKTAAWGAAYKVMVGALCVHFDTVAAECVAVAARTGAPFRGIDGSLAPSPDAASITEIYRLLGVPTFGLPGTLEASAFLTRVLKAAVAASCAPGIGYTGLMLPPLEDTGLAAAAAAGAYGLTHLLAASAVCGVGLDTVPIPGDAPAVRIAALLGDVGALAWRLNKPLSVRLFPVPGLAAGDATVFTSPFLCNGRVFAL
jgi:uncharacterized protein (UPF0210 family)